MSDGTRTVCMESDGILLSDGSRLFGYIDVLSEGIAIYTEYSKFTTIKL